MTRKAGAVTNGRVRKGDDWPDARYGWFVVVVLMLAYIVSYIDRLIMTLLAPQIQADLDLSDTQVSLLIGFAFALFYASMAIPIGRLVDGANRRNIIVAGVGFWTLMTALCGLARSFPLLFGARVGVGVGEAALGPAATSLISDYFPPERRARPTSVFTMGGVIGVSAAYIVGGILIGLTRDVGVADWPIVGQMQPWQRVFVYVAIPGVFILLLLSMVREPARRGLANSEKTTRPPFKDVIAFAKRRWRTYVAFYLGSAAMYVFAFALISWAPTLFLRRYGLSEEEFGPIFGTLSLVLGVVGAVGSTYFVDFLRRRGYRDDLPRAIFLLTILGGPSMLLAPLMPNMLLCIVAMAPSKVLMVGLIALPLVAIQMIVPNEMRGLFTAIFFFTANMFGLAGGPFLTALLTDYVFKDPMMLHWSLFVVGALFLPLSVALVRLGMRDYIGAKEDAKAWA